MRVGEVFAVRLREGGEESCYLLLEGPTVVWDGIPTSWRRWTTLRLADLVGNGTAGEAVPMSERTLMGGRVVG